MCHHATIIMLLIQKCLGLSEHKTILGCFCICYSFTLPIILFPPFYWYIYLRALTHFLDLVYLSFLRNYLDSSDTFRFFPSFSFHSAWYRTDLFQLFCYFITYYWHVFFVRILRLLRRDCFLVHFYISNT